MHAIGAAARGASTPGHAPRCARLGRRASSPSRPSAGPSSLFTPPGSQTPTCVCERRPTGICEWLREHRRRGCALRSAAGLLRPMPYDPAPNVSGCVNHVASDQRRRVQSGRCRSLAESRWRADDVLLSLAATSSCPNRHQHPWCTESCTGQFRRHRPSAGLALSAAAARHAPMRRVDECNVNLDDLRWDRPDLGCEPEQAWGIPRNLRLEETDDGGGGGVHRRRAGCPIRF